MTIYERIIAFFSKEKPRKTKKPLYKRLEEEKRLKTRQKRKKKNKSLRK